MKKQRQECGRGHLKSENVERRNARTHLQLKILAMKERKERLNKHLILKDQQGRLKRTNKKKWLLDLNLIML